MFVEEKIMVEEEKITEIETMSFDDLPDEIILQIISYETIDTLSILLGISKRFLILTSSSLLPILDDYSSNDISNNDILTILSNSEYFVNLSLLKYHLSKEILTIIEKKNSKYCTLKKLFINCSKLTDKSITNHFGSKTLPNLKELGLKFDSWGDHQKFDLKNVLQLTKLENLYIEYHSSGDEANTTEKMSKFFAENTKNLKGITLIHGNPFLYKYLNFNNLTKCTFDVSIKLDLTMFKNSEHLKYLNLSCIDVKETSLCFESVETLIISLRSNVSKEFKNSFFIDSFPKLKTLSLDSLICSGFWKVLDKLKLENLSFKRCDIKFSDLKDDLNTINQSLHLKTVKIHDFSDENGLFINDKDLINLVHLSPFLEELIIDKCHFTEYATSFNFFEKRKLKYLTIANSKNVFIENVLDLIFHNSLTLKSVNLSKTEFLNVDSYNDYSNSSVEELTYLNLENSESADKILNFLIDSGLKTLKYLNINDCQVECLEKLLGMNSIISQFFAESSQIKNDYLKFFSTVELTSLNLSYTNLTEEGLELLSDTQLSHLEDLRFFGNKIKNKSKLYKILSKCTSLRCLSINVQDFGLEDDIFESLSKCYFIEDILICGKGNCSKKEIQKFVLEHQFLKYMILDDSPFLPDEIDVILQKCRKKGRRAPKLILSSYNAKLKKNMKYEFDQRKTCIIS
eukprot:gene5057-8652_t